MLLAPKLEQRTRQPAAVGPEMMNARVASGANGQQQFGIVPPGTPVMDMERRVPCPASPAAAPIPCEHGFPVRPETPARIPLALAATPALGGPARQGLATAAEQLALLHAPHAAGCRCSTMRTAG
jgi:hypothetical protein